MPERICGVVTGRGDGWLALAADGLQIVVELPDGVEAPGSQVLATLEGPLYTEAPSGAGVR